MPFEFHFLLFYSLLGMNLCKSVLRKLTFGSTTDRLVHVFVEGRKISVQWVVLELSEILVSRFISTEFFG